MNIFVITGSPHRHGSSDLLAERFIQGAIEARHKVERFDAAFVGFGGTTGFLQARMLRERDHNCRIVLVDDTQQFAVQGVRIHCTDLIIRPVEFRHVVRSMRLVTGGGMR